MPVIDVHAHFGSWPFAIRGWDRNYTNGLLERYEIEKCIFSSSEAVVSNFMEGNRKLAEAIVDQPRMLGYVVVNPNYVEESVEEMRKYLPKPNFVGVKFHNAYSKQMINTPASKEILNSSRRYAKPVLSHTWGVDGVNALLEAAKEFKTLNFIMAHMGGNAWQYAIEIAEPILNIFLEPASSLCDRDKVRTAVERIGDRRFLFGSDLTLINPAAMLGMIHDADLRPAQKERILYRNAKELFGI